MDKNNPLKIIELEKLDVYFEDKPIVIGGMAMEYYGIRKHGDDVDFIVSNRDYKKLESRYRNYRKDRWGDLGVRVNEFEMFRSIWKLDYSYYNVGAIEFDNLKVVSIDMLLRMQVFAMDSEEKNKNDVELIKKYFLQYQNKEWVEFMNKYSDKYIKAERGIILNGDYY
jgi:hypothetical protein